MSTLYISPTGSGNHSGSDWANAATISSLNTLITKAGAGGTVLLQADAGAYTVTGPINITANIAGLGVTIKGVSSTGSDMDAVINGTRPAVYAAGNPEGNELFKFQAGSGNLTFENMTINNTGTAFRAAGDTHNITIDNVDANNVGRFFEDTAGGTNTTATITGLTLSNINVEGFSKGAVRLQYNSSNITIENMVGDSQRQDGDNFAEGVSLEGTVHNVVIKNTTMENATDTTTGNYWNGDGFATEAGVYNVTFQNTIARGNTDAGYDLKSTQTTLIDTVSEDNSRNYRVWGNVTMIDPVGLNPDKRGGSLNSQTQVWVAAGATLSITGGHFADAGSGTTPFINEGGTITVSDTDVTYASGVKLITGAASGFSALESSTVKSVGVNSAAGEIDYSISTPVVTTPVVTPPVVTTPVITVPVVITAPVVTSTPVVTTPVVTTPVVTTPVVTAPVVTSTPDTSTNSTTSSTSTTTHAATVTIISTSANETFTATTGPEKFVYDNTAKMGADTINGFGSTDLLLTTKALSDGNGDGIITFGTNGLLDLGSKLGTIKMPNQAAAGLRLLGQVDGDYAYGDAAVRPTKALEGHLGVADTLTGDKGDKVANTFFVDNALDQNLGDDKLVLFGQKDILVTTAQIANVAVGGTISAVSGAFSLDSSDAHLGSLTLSDNNGAAVQSIEYDGTVTHGTTQYFIYSLVGSSAGLGTFHP